MKFKTWEEMYDYLAKSWSAYLGIGGAIMDDDSWNRSSHKDKYLARSYDFCKAHFNDEGWCDTKDYITM